MTVLTLSRDEYEAVRRLVAPCASKDKNRKILCQVHVRVRNRRREYTATDSYRAARYRGTDPTPEVGELLIDAKQFRKAAPKRADTMPVEAERLDAWLKAHSYGGYPNMDKIFRDHDKPCHPVTAIDEDDWLKAATGARLAEKYPSGARLLLSRSRLRVEIEMDEYARGLFHVDVESDGAPALWVKVNGRYLYEFVKADPTAVMWLPEDNLSAVWFTADRWQALLMTVRG